MEKCFVIQPFDNSIYDLRFNDTFEPAITKAGFYPYRVDRDLSVRVPIDDIEEGISESAICFAEITTDNPNVWYELGFAFACNKDVVMVCSDERTTGKFPFDIQHRHILSYKTGSKSDFNELEKKITEKIIALQKKSKKVYTLNSTPVVETEGLKSHEIALLILITANLFMKEDEISVNWLKHEMSKSGYTDIATSVGIRALTKYEMIETLKCFDQWNDGQEYTACKLLEKGEQWILNNQEQLQFRKPENTDLNGNFLPF